MPMLPAVLLKRKPERNLKEAKRRKGETVESSDSDDAEDYAKGNQRTLTESGEDVRSRTCPYLDTINRNMLDFDFEKLCSVSLTHLNVYACLICGKYFQGRGTSTHAYTHSVSDGHHVFLNLETRRFYCLPDDYEIIDGSLEDITYLLNPTFTKSDLITLDTNTRMVRAYNGLTYYQGIVGLNNIKANDYCNVILQMLSHVSPLRDYFLNEANYRHVGLASSDQMHLLVQRFGELVRKLWNPRNFKTHVSPHEFLQAVVLCSRKRFQFTEQGDCVEFLSWLLNALDLTLHAKLPAAAPRDQQQRAKTDPSMHRSVIARSLRGRMRVYSRKIMPVSLSEEEKAALVDNPEYMLTVNETKFFYLTCDLPPPPLYLDEFKESIIPQVALSTLLTKFNGLIEKEYKTHRDSFMRRFELCRLPPYLILYMKRIVRNIFTLEKNPTIVNFPIKSIDFGDLLNAEHRAQHKYTTYDLVANVVHDGPPTPGSGSHRIHLLHRGTGKWFELQDLHVVEVLPQMIPLSETLIQVWAVNTSIPNPFYTTATSKGPQEAEAETTTTAAADPNANSTGDETNHVTSQDEHNG